MGSLRNRLYLLMVLTGILLALSACGSSTSGSIEDDVQKDSEDSGEYSEEVPSDMPTDAPTDYSDEYYEDMEDIYRAREELEKEYLQESMYCNQPDMDEDRFFYRISCLANFPPDPYEVLSSFFVCANYEDILRNIYDYSGVSYGFDGTVELIERTGFSTELIIDVGSDGSQLVSCSADTDIRAVTGDHIVVFGTLYPGSYYLTEANGSQRLVDCPGLDVRDYYVGVESQFKSGPNEKGQWDVDGTPNLPPRQQEYWFGNAEYTNRDGRSVVLTETSINGHPYTVHHHRYIEDAAELLLYFRFDEISQCYNEDSYTVLRLRFNEIHLGYTGVGENGSIYSLSGDYKFDIMELGEFGIGWRSFD